MAASSSQAAGEPIEMYSAEEALKIAQNAAGDAILLVGQTGAGKSTLGNALLGITDEQEKQLHGFPESDAKDSCTEDVQVAQGTFFGKEGGKAVTVIDTPGFLDSKGRAHEMLAGIMDFLEHFPKDRLRLVIVPLPLTEMRANITYTNMLLQIRSILGPSVWAHTLFVMTLKNRLRGDDEEFNRNKGAWQLWLAEHGVPNPQAIIYDSEAAAQDTLAKVKDLFSELEPFTPKAADDAKALVKAGNMTLEKRMEELKEMEDLKNLFETRYKEQLALNQELAERLREQADQSAEDRRQLEELVAENKVLAANLEDLKNRPPQIVMMGGGGGCCISGSSTALRARPDGSDVSAVAVDQIREGDFVVALDEKNCRVLSEVYFVDGEHEPTPMLELCYTLEGDGDGGAALLTADHVMFVSDASKPDGRATMRADKVRVGHCLFVSDASGEAHVARVTSIRHKMAPSRFTVLTKCHNLLVDDVLTSCHVFDHELGIVENAAMLFVYEHISSQLVASAANKWFSRQVDRVMTYFFA